MVVMESEHPGQFMRSTDGVENCPKTAVDQGVQRGGGVGANFQYRGRASYWMQSNEACCCEHEGSMPSPSLTSHPIRPSSRRGFRALGRRGERNSVLAGVLLLLAIPDAMGACYTAESTPAQGLCTNTYKVKVCAASQEDAKKYVSETHGIIVKANCKKALTILCGGLGGGAPNDDWASVCCQVANQCETDADCGHEEDPYNVPMCCQYCMDMYTQACQSEQPVNSGFMSVGTLYHSFYATDVRERCHHSTASNVTCVSLNEDGSRPPGKPCLGAPERSKEPDADAYSNGGRSVGISAAAALMACIAASLTAFFSYSA